METENDNRTPITLRVRPSALEWLDGLARDYHLHRAQVIRACLAVARKHDADLDRLLDDEQTRI